MRCKNRIADLENENATMVEESHSLEVRRRGEAADYASRISIAENNCAMLRDEVCRLEHERRTLQERSNAIHAEVV